MTKEGLKMRLDKFLKVSRLIKRRTLAKEVSDAGRVTINGRVAKPSSEVKVGDILEIGFGAKMLRAEILELKETVKAEEAKNLYRIVE
jgi:ribosomal 50S subunit-recycling heat shock protein